MRFGEWVEWQLPKADSSKRPHEAMKGSAIDLRNLTADDLTRPAEILERLIEF